MNHIMRLNKQPFEMIKSGVKTIEYRLNDEKRQQIKIGDTITFSLRPLEKEVIKAEVVDLKYYDSLLDMYSDTFDNHLKDMYKTPKEAVLDTPYYTDEEVKKYGCVAIYINLIDKENYEKADNY